MGGLNLKKEDDTLYDLENQTVFWIMCLFYLFLAEDISMEKMWKEFAEEIKTQSRFFPKSGLLAEVEKMTTYATNTIRKREIFYRARNYHTNLEYAEKELVQLLPELQKQFPELGLLEEDIQSETVISFLETFNGITGSGEGTINRKITELKKDNGGFYGFDSKNSDAPNSQRTGDGRANAKHISFLYTAFDVETAIMEIAPKIDQPVSVAEVELNKDLKVFDFSNFHKDGGSEGITLTSLSKYFSSPNYNDESEYLPTQYLCEYIRELGFEGVCFNSSVNSGHKNLVIFDCISARKPYKIIGSKVYKVREQNIMFDQILPQY